jgi:type III secretory pathway component EscS
MDSTLISIGREALLLVLLVSAPPLGAALVAGVVTGVVQAATQVQDPAIAVVPRLAAALATLGATGPWIAARVCRFAGTCLELAARWTS